MPATKRTKVLWFTAGVSLGTGIGLLIAPRSGAETRRFLAEKSDAGRQAIADSGKEFIGKTRELYERGCQIADEAAAMFEDGRRLVEEAPAQQA